MMWLVRVAAILSTLALVVVTHGAPRLGNGNLPKCPYDDTGSEIQFYEIEIDVFNVPETCLEEDMITIGLLIQDVVDEVEDRMPQYEGEKSITLICPFPEEVERRARGLARRRRYKYAGTGRACRRCRNKTTARRRRVMLQQSTDLCTIAERAQASASYSASTCHAVLESMKNTVEEKDFESGRFILGHAKQSAHDCQVESHAATEAAKSTLEVCKTTASQLRPSEDLVKRDAETAETAAIRAKNALAQLRRASFDLNTLLYTHTVQSRHRDLQVRKLGTDLCEYKDIAALEYDRATLACDEADRAMKNIEKIAKKVDTKKAWESLKRVEENNKKCTKEVEDAEKLKDTVATLCKKGKVKELKKAKELSEKASSAADEAEDYLSEVREYQSELGGPNGNEKAATNPTPVPPTHVPPTPVPPTPVPPTPSPPTPVPPTEAAPTEIPPTPESLTLDPLTDSLGVSESTLDPLTDSLEVSEQQIAPSQEEYLSRLKANLGSSDTSCEQVKQAMLQKTLAEEAVVASDLTYDEIMDLAAEYRGNPNVEKIKAKAEHAHTQVEAEAIKARAAADLASELCSQVRTRHRVRRLVEESVQAEAEIAAASVLESRLALSEERAALDEMEEMIALIEFAPAMSDLESTVKEDEASLVTHLDTVETEIKHVDSQLDEMPDTSSPEATALEKKKDSLVEEENLVEDVLTNQEHFLIGDSALKKDEFYESVSPNFVESPPLRFELKYRKKGKDKTIETNWDQTTSTDSGPKETWFRRFGDYLVDDIPVWLELAFKESDGGCISDDSDLSVDVVITELKTMWEKLNQAQCSSGDVVPSEEPGSLSCPETAAGPIPVGGRAIWSSTTKSSSGTPFYREFDGSTFEVDTLQGANAIDRYIYGFGASSPLCYEQLFVGVTSQHEVSGTRWDGSTWETISVGQGTTKLGYVPDPSLSNVVGAYESQSGRAMIVFTDETDGDDEGGPLYSLWDGAENGKWSDPVDVDQLYIGEVPKWFDIASSPISDEMVMAFTDDRTDIFVTVWDGLESRWTPTIDFETATYHAGIAVAYEVSGRAMFVYGKKRGKRNEENMWYRIWSGSTWEDEEMAFPLGDVGGINWIVLRSDPSSDRLVASAIIPNGCVWLSIWNGNAWEATEEGSCSISDIDSPSASVAFESASGNALAVFGEQGSSDVFYKTLTNGETMWSNKMMIDGNDVGATPTSVALYSNPDLDSNQIMLMVKNNQNSMFAASWDGSNFGTFTQLESDVGAGAKMPFSFLWN